MTAAMDARNMYSNLAVNKYLHTVASCWIYSTYLFQTIKIWQPTALITAHFLLFHIIVLPKFRGSVFYTTLRSKLCMCILFPVSLHYTTSLFVLWNKIPDRLFFHSGFPVLLIPLTPLPSSFGGHSWCSSNRPSVFILSVNVPSSFPARVCVCVCVCVWNYPCCSTELYTRAVNAVNPS